MPLLAATQPAMTTRTGRPGLAEPLVARAICRHESGETRGLYATRISLGGASILSLRPPPVGEELTITFYPRGMAWLSPIRCRVIASRVDPANATRSGFDVVFVELDDAALDALENRIAALEARNRPCFAPEGDGVSLLLERRRDPRVAGARKVIVSLPGRQIPLTLTDLSMTGARIALDGRRWESMEICLGARIDLTIVDPFASDSVTLRAEVVRRMTGAEAPGFAVRFVDQDLASVERLEGLILDLIVSRVA